MILQVAKRIANIRLTFQGAYLGKELFLVEDTVASWHIFFQKRPFLQSWQFFLCSIRKNCKSAIIPIDADTCRDYNYRNEQNTLIQK